MATQLQFQGTGRRKNAVARVRLVPGEGKFSINKRDLAEYMGKKTLEMIVQQPFNVTDTLGKYDVIALVHGGGTTGQAGALRLGIARALIKSDAGLRPALKRAGFLTRPTHEGAPQIRLEESS